MLKRFVLVLLFALSTTPLGAEVLRIEVNSRADILPEKSFGSVGGFEKFVGKIYFAVDPRNTANQIITDIDKAPQSSSGKVEFSSDFYMIKPKDMSRGNGTVLYEVSNRGNKGMLGYFNRATVNNLDPKAEADFGDGFLLAQGFTLLWVGWQFDAPSRDGMLRVYVPSARKGWQSYSRVGPKRFLNYPEDFRGGIAGSNLQHRRFERRGKHLNGS